MAKNKQTVTIDANLDISQFLANYKKMIATMKQQGGDQNALASMEKTFDNLTKRANTLEAASKQTFSNSKEIERYQQKVENLKKDILTAGTAMQTFASNSANFDSKELENAQKELQKIIKQINDVKKTQQTQVASGLGDLGFKNAKDLAKQIDSQEELNKALEKEYDIRSQTKHNLQQERNAKIASINQKYADNSVVKTSDFKAGTDKAGNADALNTDIQIMMSLGANSRQIMEQLEDDHEDILGDLKQQIDLEQRLNVLLQERDALIESTKTDYDNRINDVEDAQFRLGNKSSGQFEASAEAQRAFRGVDFAGDAATIQNLQGQAANQRTVIDEQIQAQQNRGEQTRRNTEDIRENNRALEENVDAYSNVVDKTHETTEKQEELNASFDNMKGTVKTLLSVGTAVSSIKDAIRQTYEDVKELDKSFAEIAMVTDYSVEEMWNSYDQYAEMANELGQTTQSVIQASGLFYQQGLETNEALELTEDTMKLATLAGLDFEKATSQMTAALRGFHMEMDEGSRVTDVYSELAAKAAADVEGIAYAMSKTASIASSAGMEFETTSAFLTQMIETTQEAPENIGTAMKTIIARFTELKENVAGTEESEFDDLSYNKVDEALQSVGVSIKDANGQFRDLDDVFLELSEKWDTLDRNSQRYIATIAAGSRQQSRFIAMMENYDRTVELVDTAYDSAGKSSEQFAKYQDTVEYKVTQLKNTWEQMRISFADSDFFKGAIDALNEIVSSFKDMDFSKILTLGVIGVTLGKQIIVNFINGMKTGFGSVTSAWQSALGTTIDKIKTDEAVAKLTKKIKTANTKAAEKALVNSGVSANVAADNARILLQYTQQQQKLKEMNAEYEKLNAKGDEINADEQKRKDELDDQLKILKEQNAEKKKQLNDAGIEDEQINEASSDRNTQRAARRSGETAETIKKTASQALTAGITTSLMVALSGGELETALTTGLMSAIASAIPVIIEKIVPKLIKAVSEKIIGPIIGAIGAIPAAIIAAVAAIAIGIGYALHEQLEANRAAREAELKRLKDIEKTNKELRKQQESSLKEYRAKDKEVNTLQNSIDRYKELSGKAFLNTSEEEELNSLSTLFQETYPDVISSMDENTGEITFNTAAIEDLTETLSEEREKEKVKSRAAAELQVGNVVAGISTVRKERNSYTELKNANLTSMRDYGYTQLPTNSVMLDPEQRKLAFGGMITSDDSIMMQDIAASAGDLLETIDKDSAIAAGFTSDFYDDITDTEDLEDFYDKIKDANMSLAQFTSKVENASQIQEESLNKQLEEQERNRVKNIIQTTEGLEGLSEEMVEALSYVASDSTQETKDRVNESKNKYFKDVDDYNEGHYDEDKDALEAIKQGHFSRITQEGYSDELKKAYEALGYVEEAEEGSGQKTYEQLFSSGTNVAEFDELTTEMQSALQALGYTAEEWNDVKDNADKARNVLDEVTSYQMMAQEGIISKDLTPEQIQAELPALNNFNETMNNYAEKTFEEYQAALDESEGNIQNEEVRKGIAEYRQESENSIEKLWENAINDLEAAGLEDTANLGYQTATYLDQMLKDLNLSESRRSDLVDVMDRYSNNLTLAQKDVLYSIDLTQSYGELLTNSEDYITKLTESGMNAADAANLFNEYIKEAVVLLGKGTFGEAGANLQKEQLNTKISGFKESYKVLFDAQKEMQEKGQLSSESYFSILEAGFEEYVDITSDGYVLLGDKAEEYYSKMATQPKEELENLIDVNKQLLEDAKDVDTSFEPIKWVSGDVLKEQYTTFDDLIAHYQKYETHVEGITDEQKEYIEVITAAGYATEEEYIKALREGTAELEKMRPDVWIQGLQNLKEATAEASEKVTNLKEKVADLNQELADLDVELAEAEDELRQAKHGSDDFQSSLDGLVNYTEKIERLDRAIEKTKNSLEDVSNVNEATGIMGQLNKQYDDKTVSLGAENKAIDAALANLQSTLTQNYGDYISFDKEGNPLIDFAYTTMDANDEIRKAFETEYNLYNDYLQKKTDNLDAIEEIEQEKQEQREESLKNFVSIQEDVISILKEKAQEEIDVTTEKYAALEEADNNYLDALQEAIDKQRQLRDKQNQYEDLATKEKKLSLLQRDTSGANKKEVLSLQREVEDDRQNLLDSEIDNMIESMRELYEKQKEARDAEIEYMEQATENTQYFAEWASNIMSTWQSTEDMQSWYLENDPNAQDMTPEQTEVYLNEIGDKYSDYVQYIATLATNFTTDQEALNVAMNEMYANTKTNVENIGTVTQDTAQKAADDLIDQATTARDDIKQKIADTKKELATAEADLKKAEENSVSLHTAAMTEMIAASQSGMEEVSGYATKVLSDMLGVDLTNPEQAEKFATTYNFKNEKGEYSENFREAVEAAGGDNTKYKSSAQYVVMAHDGGNSEPIQATQTKYSTREEAQKAANDIKSQHASVWVEKVFNSEHYGKYAQGGLVNYTGPAWVDGTPNKPEAFLSAEDTARIGEAAKLLAQLPIFNSPSSDTSISSNVGDTSIEIHINVENLSSDYDVDQMIERVKKDIVDVSKPIGSSVILNK